MKAVEQQKAAKQFAKDWLGRGEEKQDTQIRKMVKEPEGLGRIFHCKIEFHPAIVFRFKTERTVFDEAVSAVFVEAV